MKKIVYSTDSYEIVLSPVTGYRIIKNGSEWSMPFDNLQDAIDYAEMME